MNNKKYDGVYYPVREVTDLKDINDTLNYSGFQAADRAKLLTLSKNVRAQGSTFVPKSIH